MELNPYQRIEIDGELIQKGEFGDTTKKFQQLVGDVSLEGKTVLDVGCNLGMMCHLATQAGAVTKGIDISPLYIKQAQSLFPDLHFECGQATDLNGHYDIIIASAMLHYVKDLDAAFSGFARCADQVLCDVWLNDSPDPVFTLSHRGIYIPSMSAFLRIVNKYFSDVKYLGPVLTPDISKRYGFQFSAPKSTRPKAVVIYGESDSGKTTLSHTYFGYQLIHTDNIFHTYKIQNLPLDWSVAHFQGIIRGYHLTHYFDFSIGLIRQWLSGLKGKDIVLEGYDLGDEGYRNRVVEELLADWDVEVIKKEKDF